MSVIRMFASTVAMAGAITASVGCASPQGGTSRVGEGYSVTQPVVKTGIEVLLSDPAYLGLIKGKKVGLITNPTGVDSRLTSSIDLLFEHPDVKLVKLFAPEHGVRGEAYAGEHVEDSRDSKTGLPIFSLHGKTRRPTPESLEGVEVMLYDVQDIGSRSYTYIYTMAYAMEGCAKAEIPFIVLDRPNPAGGHIMDGNVLNPDEYSTFVGLYAIPYQYGMTPGEIAGLFNQEFNAQPVDLTVVPMKGYSRSMMQWDTGIPFVPTSTHIPSAKHAVYYNLTGIIGEIPHISIGVGYTLPFEVVAAPWINAEEFTAELRKHDMPGILMRPISFRPSYSRFKEQMIHGTHFVITDYDAVRPVEAQIVMMEVLQKLYPEQGLFTDEKAKQCLFDEVMGTNAVRQGILAGKSAAEITAGWPAEREAFANRRSRYLIYQ